MCTVVIISKDTLWLLHIFLVEVLFFSLQITMENRTDIRQLYVKFLWQAYVAVLKVFALATYDLPLTHVHLQLVLLIYE